MKSAAPRKNSQIIIPEGEFCARYQCSDCVYLDLDDYKNGEFYCQNKRKYYPASDVTCREFIEKK